MRRTQTSPVASLLMLATPLLLASPAPAWSQGVSRVAWSSPFNSADTAQLDDPSAPNQLAAWMGRDFSIQLQWSAAGLLGASVQTWGELDRVWAFVGAGQVSVAGGLPVTPSVLNYVGTRNDWAYDGSQGVLPAGIYDEVDVYGLGSACTTASGPAYFGECTLSPGAPLRYSFSINLIGSAGMLADAGVTLPLGSGIPRGQIKAVITTLELWADNTRLVGQLQSIDTSATMLSRLTLDTVPAVPEPATFWMALLGLLGLGARLRQR